MKALLLSGGSGTRLRPLTHTMAKQLVPVANKPVIVHCLEVIRELGIRDVGIIVGGRAEEIENSLGSGRAHGVDLTYIPQHAPLGLAHCVQTAADFLGADDFVMLLGDNVFAGGLSGASERFREERPSALVVTKKVTDPENYGVAEVDPEGVVLSLAEKPREPVGDLALTGGYFFTAAIHAATRAITPSARGELEITDAIAHLVASGQRVLAAEYTDYWADTGTIEGLLDCNRRMLERMPPGVEGDVDERTEITGRVVVERGARVRASRLTGPVAIAAGSVVEDSVVGPDVTVGAGSRLSGVGVSDTIVLDGASVRGLGRVRASVIGSRAVITGSGDAVGSVCVGDDARVEIGS
ncbi:glucose-1-phosphate thymidylyltransferase [Actinomadura chibensis]|uniref:Glucose-1-phosphate thymidylyltransferase n=1 Tax=Actinomadura chibensis TaxID=392828 RepID=A0A5D0NUC7_9ACTN|nr:glucose-1-phosphate thymidylyltransferase [Actinomadura chibensis]TYB47987.1 glucose-1-phosphate thymidylyltransferase [Actinomadura chibensis]